MKKYILILLVVFQCVAGAESDLERILKGAQSSDPNSQEWFVGELRKFVDSSDRFRHAPLLEILAKEGIDRQTTKVQLLALELTSKLIFISSLNPDNIHYLIDIAKKGISARNSQVRSESLKCLVSVSWHYKSVILGDQDVCNKIIDCALKGYKDGHSNVQREALELLRYLDVDEQCITGDNISLVRKALESYKCYVRNLTLYQQLFQMLFSEDLSFAELAAKNNITPDEVRVEYNIVWKILNDKNASSEERSDAFFYLLDLLELTDLLDEKVMSQVFPLLLEKLINPRTQDIASSVVHIIGINLFMLSDKPELLNQLIAVCCQGVMSDDVNVRINCYMILMWLVDNKLIKTIDQAKLVVKAMRVGMQDSDEHVRDNAFQLRELLYNKGFLKRGMLSASIASGFSSKAVAQNNEPSELAKSVSRLSGVNPEKFMQGAGAAVSSSQLSSAV